jgi:hypothetical protein
LFVTIFADLFLLSIKLKPKHLYPDARQCSSFTFCSEVKYALTSIVTAHTAPVASIKLLHRDSILLATSFYRRRACSQSKLYPDCKNCAMPRSLRLWWDYHHSQDTLIASIRLSTTNALYCRAVSGYLTQMTPTNFLRNFFKLV